MNLKLWYQKRFNRWLDKRIPDNRQFQMDMSNIFIFPSKFGIIYCLLCGLLFILGTNYRNNLMLLLSYFLLAMFLVNLLISYSNFARLKVQLGKVSSVFAQNDCPLPLWLGDSHCQNISELNCSGKIHFRFWKGEQHKSIEAETHSNPIILNLTTHQRGYIVLPRITIESFYPLGLFRCWTHIRFINKVLIYAKPIATELTVTNAVSGEEETLELDSLPGQNDFDTLKTYEQGEPLSRVAWKLVAKGGDMMSKQFTDALSSALWLDIRHYDGQGLESAVGKLTWLVIELTQRKVTFGLVLGEQKIEADSGNSHMERCLESLALYNLPQNQQEKA